MQVKNIVSITPVDMNGWVVQGSVFNNDSICLILQNVDFDVLVIRYFTDEVQAHLYLKDLVYGVR